MELTLAFEWPGRAARARTRRPRAQHGAEHACAGRLGVGPPGGISERPACEHGVM